MDLSRHKAMRPFSKPLFSNTLRGPVTQYSYVGVFKNIRGPHKDPNNRALITRTPRKRTLSLEIRPYLSLPAASREWLQWYLVVSSSVPARESF